MPEKKNVSFCFTLAGAGEKLCDFLKYVDRGKLSYFKIEKIVVSTSANLRLRFKSDVKENEKPLTANFTETENDGVYFTEFEREILANENVLIERKFDVYSKLRLYGDGAATFTLDFEYEDIISPPAIEAYQLSQLISEKSMDELKVTYQSDIDDI